MICLQNLVFQSSLELNAERQTFNLLRCRVKGRYAPRRIIGILGLEKRLAPPCQPLHALLEHVMQHPSLGDHHAVYPDIPVIQVAAQNHQPADRSTLGCLQVRLSAKEAPPVHSRRGLQIDKEFLFAYLYGCEFKDFELVGANTPI